MATTDSLDAIVTDDGRTWLGALGVVAVAASLLWAAGPPGLLVGLLVAVLWYALPGSYAVAAGHVALLPVLPTPELTTLVALEAGFVAVLVAPAVRDRDWPFTVAAVAGIALVLGAVAWTGWHAWEPRWLAALAVIALVVVGMYGLHRYAVVTIELRGAEPHP
jgi:hypothetical protein